MNETSIDIEKIGAGLYKLIIEVEDGKGGMFTDTVWINITSPDSEQQKLVTTTIIDLSESTTKKERADNTMTIIAIIDAAGFIGAVLIGNMWIARKS